MDLNLDPTTYAGIGADVLAQHMGQLHAYEHLIVYALAFGPFIVLGIVVWFVRRRDLAEEAAAAAVVAGTTRAAAADADDDPSTGAPGTGEPGTVSPTHPRAT